MLPCRLTSRSTDAGGGSTGGEDVGVPAEPMSAPPTVKVQAHGQMNPLAWDNLPSTLRETMNTIHDLATDVTNMSGTCAATILWNSLRLGWGGGEGGCCSCMVGLLVH